LAVSCLVSSAFFGPQADHLPGISLLKAKLDGLGESLQVYLGLIAKKASGETIRMQFIATNTLFVAAAPEFKNPNYQWTLGPLFAIFSQFHISLLRDCVLHGKAWNWPSEEDFQYYVGLTQSAVNNYIGHIDKVLSDQKAIWQRNAPARPGQHRTDIYNYWQPFNQQKVVAFDDYRQLLIYLDPIAHPGPTARIPFAEAYSWAYGTADNWDSAASAMSTDGGVTTPYGNPLTMIDSIYIEFFDSGPRVLTVQHKSDGPQLKGGNRVNQYGIITNHLPGVEKQTTTFTPVAGRDFVIQKASLRNGSIPLTLKLMLYDGSEKQLWNKWPISGGTWYTIEVEGRMLTTLNMWTLSRFYNDDLGCIIFGFNRDSQYVPPKVRDLLYVTSIHEPGDYRTDTPTVVLDKEHTAYWDELKRLADKKSTG